MPPYSVQKLPSVSMSLMPRLPASEITQSSAWNTCSSNWPERCVCRVCVAVESGSERECVCARAHEHA